MIINRTALGRELGIAAAIVVVDQAAKAVVRSRLALHESVPVIADFFNLTRVHNTGAAFGMLNGVDFPFKTAVLAIVATAALVGLVAYAASLPGDQPLGRAGLAFIVGGAAGNLIDRIAAGYVVGARAGSDDFDEIVQALQALRDSEEVHDLLRALRSHLGHTLRGLADVVDGTKAATVTPQDLVERVRRLVGNEG